MKSRVLYFRIASAVILVGGAGIFLFRLLPDSKHTGTSVSIAGKTENLALASPAQIQAVQKEQAERATQSQLNRNHAEEAGRPMEIFLGKVGDGSYRARLEALRQILATGHDQDIKSLYELASQSTQGPVFKGLKHLEWAGLVNEIMDYAVESDPNTARALDYLYGAVSNVKQDPTIRDYAFQHLDRMFSRLGQNESSDLEGREKVKAILWKVAQDPRSPLAGTSLLSLIRMMNGEGMDGDRDRLRESAVSLLKHPAAHPASQITCLALAARLGDPEALTAARNMLKEKSNVTLTVTCIGVMAQIGESSDLAVLEQLSKDRELTVRRAAYSALNRLKNRLGAS